MSSPVNVMSIDVEDWFHILDLATTPDLSEWDRLESRVAANTDILLAILAEAGVKATFFTLGWVADRHPHIVGRICAAGHELASHGYAHQLVNTQTPAQFRADVRRSKAVIEDVAGRQVTGYRAPGFSIDRSCMWSFDVLAEEGFTYDASVFPGRHGHGGLPDAPAEPFRLMTASGSLAEFPMTQARLAGLSICFSGGGYLRALPLPAILRLSARTNAAGQPIVYYLHPREIDPDHPRLPMPSWRRFKSYVNLSTTAHKLKQVLSSSTFVPMGTWLSTAPLREVRL